MPKFGIKCISIFVPVSSKDLDFQSYMSWSFLCERWLLVLLILVEL